jgi:hypothetical protein
MTEKTRSRGRARRKGGLSSCIAFSDRALADITYRPQGMCGIEQTGDTCRHNVSNRGTNETNSGQDDEIGNSIQRVHCEVTNTVVSSGPGIATVDSFRGSHCAACGEPRSRCRRALRFGLVLNFAVTPHLYP